MDSPDYSQPPHDKMELLARIQREWEVLQSTIASLSEAQMKSLDNAGWSIKDHLAHLSAWEDFLRLYHLGGMSPEEALQIDAATYRQGDFDTQNAALYQRFKDFSMAQVIERLNRSHAEVLADLDRRSFADLMKPHYPDDPAQTPLLGSVIGDTYDHYMEHRSYIQRLIDKAKSG